MKLIEVGKESLTEVEYITNEFPVGLKDVFPWIPVTEGRLVIEVVGCIEEESANVTVE